MSGELQPLSRQLGENLLERGLMIATAESCTGGWVAKALTDIAGSSGWVECGFVTYSNRAKTGMLGVAPDLIEAHGAVSEPVVRAMAEGALARSGADVAVALSGIAGPDGGSTDKPVGTVWIAWAGRKPTRARVEVFDGDREAVRRQAVVAALQGTLEFIT